MIQAEKDSIYKNSLAQRGDGVAEMIFQVSDMKTELDLLKKDVVWKTLFLKADIFIENHYINPSIQISTFFQYQQVNQ